MHLILPAVSFQMYSDQIGHSSITQDALRRHDPLSIR